MTFQVKEMYFLSKIIRNMILKCPKTNKETIICKVILVIKLFLLYLRVRQGSLFFNPSDSLEHFCKILTFFCNF